MLSINQEALATSSVVEGELCSDLGVSTLSSDGKSIAYCLKNDSNALVWKTTSANVPKGVLCGFAVLSTTGGAANGGHCTTVWRTTIGTNVAPCNNKDILGGLSNPYGGGAAVGNCGANVRGPSYTATCPTGYTFTIGLSGNTESYLNSYMNHVSCVKN